MENLESLQKILKDIIANSPELDRSEINKLPEHNARPVATSEGYSISIPTAHLKKFEETIKLMNRRLKKMKADEITIEVRESTQKRFGVNGSVTMFTQILVKGIYPRFNNCQFMGKVEFHKEAGIQIFLSKGFEDEIKIGDITEPYCEYCNSKRDRKYTYLIKQNDEIKMVGKSCLSRFVGTADLESVLWKLSYISDEKPREKGLFGYAHYPVDLSPFYSILCALLIIEKFGYTRQFKEFHTALLTDNIHKEQFKSYELDKLKAESHHYALAFKIIEWIINLEPTDNFTNNIKVEVLKGGERFGLTAWGAIKFLGLKLPPKEERVYSKPLGEIGTEVIVTGKLTGKEIYNSSYNRYGMETHLEFVTEEGNIFYWHTSSNVSDFTVNETYTLKGKIKWINFSGIVGKKTKLIRCKVISDNEKK